MHTRAAKNKMTKTDNRIVRFFKIVIEMGKSMIRNDCVDGRYVLIVYRNLLPFIFKANVISILANSERNNDSCSCCTMHKKILNMYGLMPSQLQIFTLVKRSILFRLTQIV